MVPLEPDVAAPAEGNGSEGGSGSGGGSGGSGPDIFGGGNGFGIGGIGSSGSASRIKRTVCYRELPDGEGSTTNVIVPCPSSGGTGVASY